MSCCRGSSIPRVVHPTRIDPSNPLASVLKKAQDGMLIDSLVNELTPNAPEHIKRNTKAQLVRELSRMGFRVTPAGRLLKK